MGNAKFTRHIYKIEKALKSYSVYQLSRSEFGECKLTSFLRIEEYRGFSNATGIKDYLRLRDTNNWATCEMVTGLRPTTKELVFYGNRAKGAKSLLLFQFSPDRKTLIIDVFPAFYPNHKGILQKIVETHPYHF